jgi:hypothetical protein
VGASPWGFKSLHSHFSAGGFMVADYFDLGTPERIALFKEKNTVN